jgi:hypothetical protein
MEWPSAGAPGPQRPVLISIFQKRVNEPVGRISYPMAKHKENHGTAQVPHNKRTKVDGTPQPVSPHLVEVPQPVTEVPTKSPANTEADVFKDYPRDEFEDNQPFYADLVTQVDPAQLLVVIEKPRERRFAAIHPESILGHGICGWILPGDNEGRKDDQKSNKPRRPVCRVSTPVAQLNSRLCRRVRFYPWVDNYGVHGVWIVMQENRRGEIHSYSKTAMDRLAEAATKGGWFTLWTEGQGYQMQQSNNDLGKPKFLGSVRDYLDRGFPPERRILTNDHPYLVELRGKPVV